MTSLSDPMLAEFDSAHALIATVVPIVLGFLIHSARKESLQFADSKSVVYPKAMRVFVVLGWLATLSIAVLTTFFVKKTDVKSGALILGLFTALILPLHLEVFGVSITWDNENIYARSPWRKRRTIPFSAVVSCDYSASMLWYRVHANSYGIVRLHSFMRGIPDLLKALPCSSPKCPSNIQRG